MILTEWKEIAKSIEKREILAAFIGQGENVVLVISCIHGDEPQSKDIALKTLAYYEENKLLLKNKLLIVIPLANPDGYKRAQRGNANGVDINRNFPTENWELSEKKDEFYSGIAPNSEPETQAITSIINKYNPKLIITIHQPYKIINYDGPAEEFAELMSKFNKYKVEKDIGYPTPGSLGTFAGKEKNIPVITLELPENESDERLWRDNGIAIVAAINHS